MFKSISEQVAYFRSKLEVLEESVYVMEQTDELLDDLLDESSLSAMVKDIPGGMSLVRYLHRSHKLGNQTEYELVPRDQRVYAEAVKANKDNFVIIVGSHGVAGVKPQEEDWDRIVADGLDPRKNTHMKYVVVWSANDEPIQTEIHKFRMGLWTGGGGTSGREGGAPNLFQTLRSRIGTLKSVYMAVGAIERGKLQLRRDLKAPAAPPDEEQIYKKVQPVLLKLVTQAAKNVGPQLTKMAKTGDMTAIKSLSDANMELKQILSVIKKGNLDQNAPEMQKIKGAVSSAIASITKDLQGSDRDEVLRNIGSGHAKELGDLLNSIRSQLMSIKP